ncbi:alanine racemase [Herbiconiux sp. KACC 21604]|uniref:alanine racemase n=1 Tax=unclassified Herbiconiux TaxID=2618217 RepID=UPI001490D24F|nr:alanine racemase [Herbiconiux sp. SALV-R1]QJU53446.1 alanine racemase [Herbiconiux sp. SALV-R1]WPO88415.1 alanine racemase [Herbiconiux sp. KACC 21604]
MTHPTGARLSIDLDAVAQNTRLFRERSAGLLIAVVKADGYGHGAVAVARAALAAGAGMLGVARLDEAFALREAGITAPLLSWLNEPDPELFQHAVDQQIDLAVPGLRQLELAAATRGLARVHLHLDTGLARDGVAPVDLVNLCVAARAAELRGDVRVVGLMGHLSEADAPLAPSNTLGRALFEWGADIAAHSGLRPTLLHLAATSAVLTLPSTRFTAARVGAGLVGIDLSRTTRLRQPMTLTAPLVGIRDVPANTPVGYGQEWRSERPTRLGLVGLGYADGLPRAASGSAEVLVRGRRAPVVGRISMDQFVVDLGDSPRTGTSVGATAAVGDTVTVFGPGDGGDGGASGSGGEPTLRDWATWSDTIEHELVTRLGSRLRRDVVHGRPAPRGPAAGSPGGPPRTPVVETGPIGAAS